MDLYRDPDTMDPEELRAYLSDIRQELEAMDEDEPEDEDQRGICGLGRGA
ncbi:MAG: hypothetical protein ACLUNQ_07750 [Oscillospiraceae bacterium]